MRTIRYGSFETNSSSTHAIVIPKKVDTNKYSLNMSLEHDYGFGREECKLAYHWDEKLAYVYMVLKDYRDCNTDTRRQMVTLRDVANFKSRVNKMYEEVKSIVKYKPYETDPKPIDIFNYIDSEREDGNITGDDFFMVLTERYGKYVDHVEDFAENGFVERVLKDDEFLKRLLFNSKSYITVGGDEYRGYNIKTIGFEYDYDNEEYRVNEKGERCPECSEFEDFDEWWELQKQYPIIRDDGGFWDKLTEYRKENDVFLKGN